MQTGGCTTLRSGKLPYAAAKSSTPYTKYNYAHQYNRCNALCISIDTEVLIDIPVTCIDLCIGNKRVATIEATEAAASVKYSEVHVG